jgi:ribosomal peptide maturation radical SAM protein 1
MPWAAHTSPLIQVGLIGAIAAAAGHDVDQYHLNLDAAATFGPRLYLAISSSPESAIGEWLFSVAAFGDDAPDPDDTFPDEFHTAVERVRQAGGSASELRRIRRRGAPAFVEHLADTIPWHRYDVVGFSSVYQQHVASLALGSAIRRRAPHVVTVLGGSNCDGEMGRETLRSMADVDYVVTGEGDEAFPALLAALAAGTDPAQVPGVLGRRDGAIVGTPPAAPFADLDSLPMPDYHEYFERGVRVGVLPPRTRDAVALPFESSRGCWWGERRHCTFCGLNGQTMRYRHKSPDRVIAEIAELARRHDTREFFAVDNILELSHVDEVFGRLAVEGDDAPFRIHYELKADLKPAQLRTLRRGGLRSMQPGIESLDSRVLALMRKGTRAAQNVNLLRWGRQLGLMVYWNVLWGFPHEPPDSGDHQAALIPKLAHLQPPSGWGTIRLHRFSPLFDDRETFPRDRLTADRSLAFVYPSHVDLARIAYAFDGPLDDVPPAGRHDGLDRALREWHQAWRRPRRPTCTWTLDGATVTVADGRTDGALVGHRLDGDDGAAFLACVEQPCPASRLEGAGEAADRLVRRGLLMRDGNLLLALPIAAGTVPDDLCGPIDEPLRTIRETRPCPTN